jgi:hypothetical protein
MLVERNKTAEEACTNRPASSKIRHLPLIIIKTDKKTLVDVSIGDFRYFFAKSKS